MDNQGTVYANEDHWEVLDILELDDIKGAHIRVNLEKENIRSIKRFYKEVTVENNKTGSLWVPLTTLSADLFTSSPQLWDAFRQRLADKKKKKAQKTSSTTTSSSLAYVNANATLYSKSIKALSREWFVRRMLLSLLLDNRQSSNVIILESPTFDCTKRIDTVLKESTFKTIDPSRLTIHVPNDEESILDMYNGLNELPSPIQNSVHFSYRSLNEYLAHISDTSDTKFRACWLDFCGTFHKNANSFELLLQKNLLEETSIVALTVGLRGYTGQRKNSKRDMYSMKKNTHTSMLAAATRYNYTLESLLTLDNDHHVTIDGIPVTLDGKTLPLSSSVARPLDVKLGSTPPQFIKYGVNMFMGMYRVTKNKRLTRRQTRRKQPARHQTGHKQPAQGQRE